MRHIWRQSFAHTRNGRSSVAPRETKGEEVRSLKNGNKLEVVKVVFEYWCGQWKWEPLQHTAMFAPKKAQLFDCWDVGNCIFVCLLSSDWLLEGGTQWWLALYTKRPAMGSPHVTAVPHSKRGQNGRSEINGKM